MPIGMPYVGRIRRRRNGSTSRGNHEKEIRSRHLSLGRRDPQGKPKAGEEARHKEEGRKEKQPGLEQHGSRRQESSYPQGLQVKTGQWVRLGPRRDEYRQPLSPGYGTILHLCAGGERAIIRRHRASPRQLASAWHGEQVIECSKLEIICRPEWDKN